MNRQSQGKRVVRAVSRLWVGSLRAPLLRLLALLGFAFVAWLLSGTVSAHADSNLALPEAETGLLAPTAEVADTDLRQIVDEPTSVAEVVQKTAPNAVDISSSTTSSLVTKAGAVEPVGDLVSPTQNLLDSPGQPLVTSPLGSMLSPARAAAAAVANDAGISNTGTVSSPGTAIPAQSPADPVGSTKWGKAGFSTGNDANNAVSAQPMFAAYPLSIAKGFDTLPVVPQPAELPVIGSTGQVGGGSTSNAGPVLKGASEVAREYEPRLNRAETVDTLADTAVSQEFSADRSFAPD